MAIRRGSFRNVRQLVDKIEQYVAHYNEHRRPFVWTATADSILAKVERICKPLLMGQQTSISTRSCSPLAVKMSIVRWTGESRPVGALMVEKRGASAAAGGERIRAGGSRSARGSMALCAVRTNPYSAPAPAGKTGGSFFSSPTLAAAIEASRYSSRL
jgi:hypothetical protein